MHRKLFRWTAALLLLAGILALLSGAAVAEGSAKWPSDPSKKLKTNGKLRLDVNNTAEGYFLASINKQSKRRMKLRVVKGKETLTYDLNGNAEFEVFPLQLGSGKYEISLYENVSGKKYSQAGKVTLNVKLSSEDAAFFYPNQYVNYTVMSAAVAKAEELCAGKSDQEAYKAVCDFMQSSFVYDFVKALTIKAGMLPDIDGAYTKRMGVCQDLSAIMCCMLRTQGIPARLMIGYADKNYHAWTMTMVDGSDLFFDPTAALNAITVKQYSIERYY